MVVMRCSFLSFEIAFRKLVTRVVAFLLGVVVFMAMFAVMIVDMLLMVVLNQWFA